MLTSLKQTCNENLIKFSENQSAPKLENRKTSPCSPCALNLLHVLVSRILGYHNLCSPVHIQYSYCSLFRPLSLNVCYASAFRKIITVVEDFRDLVTVRVPLYQIELSLGGYSNMFNVYHSFYNEAWIDSDTNKANITDMQKRT